MKTLPLLACLAVAAIASAADPKDPAVVASEWNKTIAQARESGLGSLELNSLNQTQPPPPAVVAPAGAQARFHRDGDVVEVPQGMIIDPKILHGQTDGMPPKGAKPWYYRGQTFWLLPIAETASPETTPAGK